MERQPLQRSPPVRLDASPLPTSRMLASSFQTLALPQWAQRQVFLRPAAEWLAPLAQLPDASFQPRPKYAPAPPSASQPAWLGDGLHRPNEIGRATRGPRDWKTRGWKTRYAGDHPKLRTCRASFPSNFHQLPPRFIPARTGHSGHNRTSFIGSGSNDLEDCANFAASIRCLANPTKRPGNRAKMAKASIACTSEHIAAKRVL